MRMVGKARAAEVGFGQAVLLDHGTHGAVEHEDPLFQMGPNLFGAVRLGLRQ